MSYTNGESVNLVTNSGNFSQRRGIQGRSQSDRHNALIKDLACDTMNCALAHWYLLPGLELQRYRLRLAFSLIRTPEALRREFSMLPATLYLDSDFALKSLRAQPRIGSYLDISSPWLFPSYILTALKPERAVLLNTSSTTRNLFKYLAKQMERNGTTVLTKELGHLSGLAESFDTITCLARLSPEQKERELLKQMWNALNPGGTLVLSVACSGAESRTDTDAEGAVDRTSLPSSAVPYDSDLLDSYILGVLGEPRSYAIYGEDASAGHIQLSPVKSVPARISAWRESVAVGKYWRRCSSISQVRGQGILAMRFIKPANLAAARQVS
jgi:hypothetical protein